MIRIVAFASVFFAYFLLPWWCALVAAGAYLLWWSGYELLILSIALDSIFGHASLHALPHYTLMTSAFIFVAAIAKPFISFYDRET